MLFVNCIFMIFWAVYSKLRSRNCKSPVCLVGKTAIVTGGNAGIGYEVCLNLATRGCRVIIADKDDSNESRKTIIRLTHNHNVVSKLLDLSDFASVRDFAADIEEGIDKVDILINNAGIGLSDSSKTVDDLDPVMQVNHFGPFLLTHLLLDVLQKSEAGRIIFTSSCGAFLGDLTSPEEKFKIFYETENYFNSKLANIMVADIFAEKLRNTKVTSNSLHPGIAKTNMLLVGLKRKELQYKIYNIIINIFGKTAWEAAQTTLHLAVSDEVEGLSGEYFWDCRPFKKPSQACDAELCRKLWELSENCVKLSITERIY